ncbi:MAG: transcriptional regulator [Acidimicrobiia bacterium]|nr:transcriptional regulator [Acidimicrobiia bacterium]
MPRNAEVIRQWTILREIEHARAAGVTIDELAVLSGVTTRTVRRDLQALEEAGFPVYDDRSNDDGRTRWRLNGQAFKGLGTGLTLAELCALYFGRTLLESLAGTPFRGDLESAFDKLSGVLTPHMQQFLDQLPRVIATKPGPIGTSDVTADPARVARLLEATLQQRQARITYHSSSSGRTKTYLIHPYRVAYAQGTLYLLAFVPEYGEVRTFAVPRIQQLSLLEERFTPTEELPDEAFPDSLGVHSGPPEEIRIAFEPGAAAYVRARTWHASQRIDVAADGSVVLSLRVSLDRALRGWVLSFGSQARVLQPRSLVGDIAREHEAAAGRYAAAPRGA